VVGKTRSAVIGDIVDLTVTVVAGGEELETGIVGSQDILGNTDLDLETMCGESDRAEVLPLPGRTFTVSGIGKERTALD